MEKIKKAVKAKARSAEEPPAAPGGQNEEKPKFPNAFTLFYPSWDALKISPGALVGLALTPILASVPIFFIVIFIVIAFSGGGQGTAEPTPYATGLVLILVYLAMAILGLMVGAGLVAASLKAARGETIKYSKAFAIGRRNFWRFTGLCLLVTLAVVVGLVLLIVPGLIMLRRYLLAPYYLLDRNLGILAAMEASARESKRYGGVWDLLLVILLISLLGVVPYFGWLVSLGVSIAYLCAPAIRYLQISRAADYQPEKSDAAQSAV